MGYVDVGVNIKADIANAVIGIRAVRRELKALHREQQVSAARLAYIERKSNEVSQALRHQSNAVRSLTGDFFALRRVLLTFSVRIAIAGLTALISTLNAVASSAVLVAGSLANLGSASVIGGIAGFGALASGVGLLVVALNGLGDAYTSVGKKHELALSKLTKTQREFYGKTKDITNALREAQGIVQAGVLPGLGAAFKEVAPLADMFKQHIWDASLVMGYLAERAGEMTRRRAPALDKILGRNTVTMRRFGTATENVLAGFVSLAEDAGPLIGRVTRDVVTFSKGIKDVGDASHFFNDLRVSWENWTATIGAAFGGIFNIWTALQPVIHEVENAIEGAAKDFEKWTSKESNQNKVVDFFRDSLEPMGAFLELLGGMAELWVTFAEAGNDDATRLFKGMKNELLPFLKDLFLYLDEKVFPRVMDLFGAMLDFVDAAMPGFKALASALGPFTDAIVFVLETAKDLLEVFNNFGSVGSAIGALLITGTIIGSWKAFRSAISLTVLTMRSLAGAQGAVMPTVQSWKRILPGYGTTQFVGGTTRAVRSAPRYLRDRINERAERIATARYNNAPIIAGTSLGRSQFARMPRGFDAGPATVPVRTRFTQGSPLGPRPIRPSLLTQGSPLGPGVSGRFGPGSVMPRGYMLVPTSSIFRPGSRSPGNIPLVTMTSTAVPKMQRVRPGRLPGRRVQGFQAPPLTQMPVFPGTGPTPGTPLRVSPFIAPIPGRGATQQRWTQKPTLVGGEGQRMFREYEQQMAKSTKGGMLKGMGGAISAGMGGMVGLGLTAAVVAGPPVVGSIKKGLSGKNDLGLLKNPKMPDFLGALFGDIGINSQMSGGEKQIREFGDSVEETYKKAKKAGDSQALVKLAHQARDLGRMGGKGSDELLAFGSAISNELLGSTSDAFKTFGQNAGNSISSVMDGLSVLQNEIGNKLPSSSREYKEAIGRSFTAAADVIKAQVDAGVVSAEKGMKKYEKLMTKALRQFGLSPKQAREYANRRANGRSERNELGSVGGGGGGGNSPAPPTQGHGGPAAARGGAYLGRKGARGRDTIPMLINGQSVMAAEGEYVGVFNSHQKPLLDHAVGGLGYGSLEDFMSSNNRPHYAQSGGVWNPAGAPGAQYPGQRPNNNRMIRALIEAGRAFWAKRKVNTGPIDFDFADDINDGGMAVGMDPSIFGQSRIVGKRSELKPYLKVARDRKHWGLRDRREKLSQLGSILFHEVGHVGGLGHSDEGLMAPNAGDLPIPAEVRKIVRRLLPRRKKKKMAGGGIVGLGHRLERMGYDVGENPAFGGVSPVHVKGSQHYSGNALDVNADNWPGGEAAALSKLASMLMGQGWHVIWNSPGHYDHLHVDGSGSGGIDFKLPQVQASGDGASMPLVQPLLDFVGNALQGFGQSKLANFSGDGNVPQGAGNLGRSEIAGLMRRAGFPESEIRRGTAIALAESGGNPNIANSIGATGLWQILLSAHPSMSAAEAKNPWLATQYAKHLWDQSGWQPWEAYTNGNYQQFMARGGLLSAGAVMSGGPPPRGSEPPDVNTTPQTGYGKGGQKKPKKKKPKKKPIHDLAGPVPGGRGVPASRFKPKKKPRKPRLRNRIKHLIGRGNFHYDNLDSVDPLTGEPLELSKSLKGWSNLTKGDEIISGAENTLAQLVTNAGLTEEFPIVTLYDSAQYKDLTSYLTSIGITNIPEWMNENGDTLDVVNAMGMDVQGVNRRGITQAVSEIDAQLGVYENTIAPTQGKQSMWAQNFYTTAPNAISERRERLKQIKKAFEANVEVRKSLREKMKAMKGSRNYTWKQAVNHNEDIITSLRRWLRDSVGETTGERRNVNHQIDDLVDENKTLRDKKPKGTIYGDADYVKLYNKWQDRGFENKKLVGDPELTRWSGGQMGGAAGFVTNQMLNWQTVKDESKSYLDTLATSVPEVQGSIKELYKAREEWTGTRVEPKQLQAPDTTWYDDLLKQIGLDTLAHRFEAGNKSAILSGMQPLINARMVGAFAHGGPIQETGMALVHRGEYVLPSPDGPYRNGMNAPSAVDPNVEVVLVFRDRAGQLVELVDSRINSRAATVTSRELGQQQRIIRAAPGG